MNLDRRGFIKVLAAGAATAIGSGEAAQASSESSEKNFNGYAMLVDTTECIGCRKCEFACDQSHGLTGKPLEAFEDKTVFDRDRRMSDTAYTVVNRIPNPDSSEKPTYVKTQCMHCLDPACVSACLVGSLTLNDTGAVTYDAWKCIGCRYCMVACPFEVPTYEFLNPLTPQVRKCDFCFDRVKNEGKIPACAEMCPPMCLSFGKYTEVLKQAHTKIKNDPDRYIDHVYGETELGGTSWLYLAGRDFKELGFQTFGPETIPSLTETIQHNVFKYGIPPVMLFGLLSASMWAIKGKDHTSTHNPSSEGKDDVHP